MINPFDLMLKVQARLVTSLGSSIRTGAVYVNQAPRGVEPGVGLKPYVVMMVNGVTLDTFTTNGARRQILIYIIDHKANGLAPSAAVWAGVYGNSAPPSTAPTVGLHRWRPTLVTGDTSSQINWESDDPGFEDDPDTQSIVMRFQIDIDYGAPSP